MKADTAIQIWDLTASSVVPKEFEFNAPARDPMKNVFPLPPGFVQTTDPQRRQRSAVGDRQQSLAAFGIFVGDTAQRLRVAFSQMGSHAARAPDRGARSWINRRDASIRAAHPRSSSHAWQRNAVHLS